VVGQAGNAAEGQAVKVADLNVQNKLRLVAATLFADLG
jgi:hypothetical protein